MQYGICDSKFHGGGILFQSRSPREVWRWLRRNHDGCFDGRGCQSFVASDDAGETWYSADLEWYPATRQEVEPGATHHYADGSMRAELYDFGGPIHPADATASASEPAL